MARGRMIDVSIWDSDQVNELSTAARLLYIATIVLADDEGCFRADAKYWHRKVFYNDRIGIKRTREMLEDMRAKHLIVLGQTKYGIAGYHPNWHKYQTLRKDRSKPSKYSELLVANGLAPRFGGVAEVKKVKKSEVDEVKKSNGRHFDDFQQVEEVRTQEEQEKINMQLDKIRKSLSGPKSQ